MSAPPLWHFWVRLYEASPPAPLRYVGASFVQATCPATALEEARTAWAILDGVGEVERLPPGVAPPAAFTGRVLTEREAEQAKASLTQLCTAAGYRQRSMTPAEVWKPSPHPVRH